MQHGLQSCEACGLLSRPAPGAQEGRCPRCNEKLAFRKPACLQRTLAYLVAAVVCYVPANLLPVLTTVTSGGQRIRHHHARRRAVVVADRAGRFR